MLPSKPVVAIVDLWVRAYCGAPRYLLHSFYYQVPLIDVCPGVVLCFGKSQHPKHIYEQYSLTDGIHPWGVRGVPFLGEILYAWWRKFETLLTHDVTLSHEGKELSHSHSFDHLLAEGGGAGSAVSAEEAKKYGGELQSRMHDALNALPPPLYPSNPIGLCTRCEALADDADGMLTPVRPPKGFRKVVRTKIGYGGFTASKNDKFGATKSFRKSWQAENPGDEISFRFFGSTVKIAIWQRRDGMGVLHAYVDGDRSRVAKASGFFKGYTWAMEKNNTGRSEIMPLFEGLEDKAHELTLVVSDEPANVWVKGHLVQVFALLSASDNLACRNVSFV
jgi:hypothetical protein